MGLLLQVFTLASLRIYSEGSSLTSPLGSYVIKRKGNTAFLKCQIKTSVQKPDAYIHWYQEKPGQRLQRMLCSSSKENIVYEKDFSDERYEARTWQSDLSSVLTIHQVTEEDTGTYYCACWDSSGFHKVFAEGTKLIVIPSDKRLDADISPKPTIFLPSVAETNLHKTGTYLCLLEKFFPDVIRVYWKEKDGNTILDSQEGDTLKTNDTYMKFSWLTVPERAMGKEHRCIVKHENNKGGADQEIFFPSIKKVAVSTKPTTCWQDKNDVLQLQFTITSAYYTYLLLLLKSVIYLAIISFSLLRRTSVCGNEKKS
nr:unnamed protein product [Mus musculus]